MKSNVSHYSNRRDLVSNVILSALKGVKYL